MRRLIDQFLERGLTWTDFIWIGGIGLWIFALAIWLGRFLHKNSKNYDWWDDGSWH